MEHVDRGFVLALTIVMCEHFLMHHLIFIHDEVLHFTSKSFHFIDEVVLVHIIDIYLLAIGLLVTHSLNLVYSLKHLNAFNFIPFARPRRKACIVWGLLLFKRIHHGN